MFSVRHIAASVALLFAFAQAASAEESFLSKLNPFSSSKPSSSSQNRPFPGFSNHSSKRKPQRSMIGQTYDSVSNTTRTAWNKTTSALSPRKLFSNSESSKKPNRTKTTGSSWNKHTSKDKSDQEVNTLSDWLSLPRP